MDNDLAVQVGELKGTLITFMDNQKIRDDRFDQRFEKLLTGLETIKENASAQTSKADAKAEAAHRRISKLQNIGYGVGAAATAAGALIKFVFNHGDQVVKAVDAVDKLHPK